MNRDRTIFAHITVKRLRHKSSIQAWIDESAELAKQYAYAEPLSVGSNPVPLTRE